MSVLFTPMNLGNVQIKNRFVHSATHESMASSTGEVTEKLINRYRRLAKYQVGLIIPGYMYIDSAGKALEMQTGIHEDAMIPGLKILVDAVHQEGSKIIFQIAHAGRQTKKSVVGRQPMGPSDNGRDPLNFVKAKPMTEGEIQAVKKSFREAARRSVSAGADGIQLHSAHGYLLNQFLSPFFNLRKDQWGGTDENKFRILKEVILEVRKEMPEGMPLIIKLNSNDYTPKDGITPVLATRYAKWLYEAGIDGIEISAGTVTYSFMNMCRGETPVDEMVLGLPWWKKPLGRMMLNQLKGKFDLVEGYNVNAAELIKPEINGVPLITVGGFRRLTHMQEVIEKGTTDFISLCRPLIREPKLVVDFKEGKKDLVACESCNRCLAAVALNLPVRCYTKGFDNKN